MINLFKWTINRSRTGCLEAAVSNEGNKESREDRQTLSGPIAYTLASHALRHPRSESRYNLLDLQKAIDLAG